VTRDGRLFNNYTEEGLRELIAAVPTLQLLTLWETPDRRPERSGVVWLNLLARRGE
jgi:hypothetical protein